MRQPLGLVEALGRPLLVDRHVVVALHPHRLEADDVAGRGLAPELAGFVEDVTGADIAVVGDVGKAVSPEREKGGTAGDFGVAIEEKGE